MYLMANDTKWVEREEDLPFLPYPGFDFVGIAGEQPLRISGMSFHIPNQVFKIRLAWLSSDPLTSKTLIDMDVGWKLKEDENEKNC